MHGPVVSVEAVGVGSFVIVRTWEEDAIICAEVEVEEGNPMLAVFEEEGEAEGAEEPAEREHGEQEQRGEFPAAGAGDADRLGGVFVPTHSTCTTRNIVVNMRTQYYKKDRWGQGHLWAFTVELHNHTDDRVRIMQRQWRVRAGAARDERACSVCVPCHVSQ